MLPAETILFDLDGTLIDTEPAAAATIRRCFAEWKIRIAPDDATYVTGRTWESAFTYLFQKYPLPIPAQQASDLMLQVYREALEADLQIVPGGARAVRDLASQFPLGLVSGSHRKEILWALDKLEIRRHFQVILGAEDYPRSKPAPDGYLKALHEMKADPKSTLIFEDSQAGIESGRAAGAWVVAITGTNHFAQDVSRAHFAVPDLQEVHCDWVRGLFKNLASSAVHN